MESAAPYCRSLLSDFVGGQVDLLRFAERLRQSAASVAIAVTCRDGPELTTVRGARSTSTARFFESIESTLRPLPVSKAEKQHLAEATGRPLSSGTSDLFPTLGAITMVAPMAAMAERFRLLSPVQRDVLFAMKLLVSAGILPLRASIKTVVWRVRGSCA